MTDSNDEILLDILDVLLDIRELLSQPVAPREPELILNGPDLSGMIDGALNVPRSEIRTYGDATVSEPKEDEGLA